MKQQPGVWGIDLGQCALKALRVQEIEGEITATAFDYVEYPKVLSQPDADPDQLVREALNTFLSRNTLRGDIVAISVPGQSGLARFVKLPPVEEKKIHDIVKFEAKQQIPFNLDEVVWDYQKIGSSTVVDGFALETEIGLFAMKRDMVNKYLQHFKDVGVEVHVIQMAPLALCNFLAYDLLGRGAVDGKGNTESEEKKGCVVALDIGADSSNLVVTDGDRIIWQRPIPVGGNHFTRALTKDLKLTFAKAEHLKRNATRSPELKKILAALKPVLNDFVGEVQRSLGYFTNTHRDAPIEYMAGLGNAFRLPGLQRFLAEKLGLEVRKLAKMERLKGDEVLASPVYTENILSFGVAYGLALQAMKHARLATNLLPGEIRLERLVRAKKPWAVAAAGVLLLGLAAGVMGALLSDYPFSQSSVKAAVEEADKAAKNAANMEAAFLKAKKDAQAEEEAVKAIVAGQSERLNWMRLEKFITDCVPQPDAGLREPKPGEKAPADMPPAGGVPPEFKNFYWDKQPVPRKGQGLVMPGKHAYEEFGRSLQGFKGGGKEEEVQDQFSPGIDDLILYHITTIDNRYCDDLKAFWKDVTKNVDEKDRVRPQSDFDKAPEGKGWIIEVHGFTYHNGGSKFVLETLVTNIARRGARAVPAPAEGGKAAPAAKGTDAKPAVATEEEAALKEPVVDRISHTVLYRTKYVPREAGPFEFVGRSFCDELLAGASGDGKGKQGGAGGGKQGIAGKGTGMPGAAGGAKGGGAATKAPPGVASPPRSSWQSIAARPGVVVPNSGQHARTEFVILFVWREPTPSDSLRGVVEAPKR